MVLIIDAETTSITLELLAADLSLNGKLLTNQAGAFNEQLHVVSAGGVNTNDFCL